MIVDLCKGVILMRVTLFEEDVGYKFYAVKYGTTRLIEMVVQYCFIDEDTGETYMVFSSTNNKKEFYLRRFEKRLNDQLFYYVDNEKLAFEIEKILNQILSNNKNDHFDSDVNL